jgi:hypothetical protein
MKINKSEVIQYVECEGCTSTSITGVRYKCKSTGCSYCSECFKKVKIPESDSEMIVEAKVLDTISSYSS